MSQTQGCVKTGARVLFTDTNQLINADVYRVGTAFVIKTHPNQLDGDMHPTKKELPDIAIQEFGGVDFWRPEIGVFVVSATAVWLNPNSGI